MMQRSQDFTRVRRYAIYSGVVGALLLATLQMSWYYAANIAVMAEETRGVVKNVLFCGGLAVVMIVAVLASLKEQDQWVQRTAASVALTVAGASILAMLARRVFGVHTTANSGLLGESALVRGAASLAGVVIYVLVVTGIGVALGGLCRAATGRLVPRS